MDVNKIAIATITWARDEHEEDVLRKSLSFLAQLNIPVFVTDAGSGDSFIQFLSSLPNFTVMHAPAKGLWLQTQNSIQKASETTAEFIFYTEPDKTDFFARALLPMIDTIEATAQTGIVLASRSDKGFATFPSFQHMTETTINRCCAEIIGNRFDFTYGPFLLNNALVQHLHYIPQNIGWGWRPFTFILSKRLGYKVESYIGEFSCPLLQRKDNMDERIYRMKQLRQNVDGITLSSTIELKDQQ